MTRVHKSPGFLFSLSIKGIQLSSLPSRAFHAAVMIFTVYVVCIVGCKSLKASQIKGRFMLKSAISLLVASAALWFTTPVSNATPQTHTQFSVAPEIYVVMFRADWCGPCKIIEPKISQALQSLSDPKIEYVTIDISNPMVSEVSAHTAFDRNIVAQYNQWLGVTGFAVIVDGDTKKTLGCVNMLYDVPAMTSHIKNLKTFAMSNQQTFDLTCPEPNNVTSGM